eukprot:TRINITY_DN3220_c0_g1_i2.p1 TRINITY_DN3220_c0_g1~~TRINITY_DN3220_c0_g1_i2.p1  ORF type:complete len:355 (-),score=14.05 TRINITY_DN3220_c0_g1_i2:60-1124(-)
MAYTGRTPSFGSDIQLRKKIHIDSLKRQFSTSVKELKPEEVFDVPLHVPNGLVLRINLIGEFPLKAPIYQIFPHSRHRFLDANSTVLPETSEHLKNWYLHSDLGIVTHDLVRIFTTDPPVVSSMSSSFVGGPSGPPQSAPPGFGRGYPPPYSGPYGSTGPGSGPLSAPGPIRSGPGSGPLSAPPPSMPALPPLPRAFPQLERKSVDELKELRDTPASLEEFIEQLDAVKETKKIRNDLHENIMALATKNLEHEKEIDEMKKQVETKREQVAALRRIYEEKAIRQQEILKRFSPEILVAKLSEAAATAGDESEAIAKRFINGDMDLKTFVSEFMKKREEHHLRSAKLENITKSGM